MPKHRDHALISSEAILQFMRSFEIDPGAKKTKALFQDLAWKARRVDKSNRTRIVQRGLKILVDRTLRSMGCTQLVQRVNVSLAAAPRRFDVAFVTILPLELQALLVALNGKQSESESEDEAIGTERYWYRTIRRDDKPTLRAVITVVGEGRNVRCAIATERLLRNFSVKATILVGIAAGLREKKVGIGDVVCAERVIDYEHVRKELMELFKVKKLGKGKYKIVEKALVSTERIRPLHITPPEGMAKAIQIFTPKLAKFRRTLASNIRRSGMGKNATAHPASKVRIHKGTVASGEKLIADGSLTDIRLKFDERLRAADQDSSGFAQACQFREPQMRWAVFRGISDYGEPSKSDQYQSTAALAAAVASLTFVRGPFRE